MYDILSLFSVLCPHLSMTIVRQFSGMVFGLLAMTGRISMLYISRSVSEGRSYRTVQRFFNTFIPFQLEFNFREVSKQYCGLEEFMNVNKAPVNNTANLSMFIVNVSAKLLVPLRLESPDFSVLNLKARYRGLKYLAILNNKF